MSPELTPLLIAVATVCVALAALMIGLFAWLRQDARQTEDRLTNRFDRLEGQANERFERLESQTNERFDRVDEKFDRMGDRITALERDHQERFASLDRGQAELRERMAKLEGLLEGLREAVTGRRAAS
jgi:uncharacterized protein YceH (UPF0502 family)